MDVWPEVNIVKEYTGFELDVEEPPIDEPRYAWMAIDHFFVYFYCFWAINFFRFGTIHLEYTSIIILDTVAILL